MKKFLVAIAMVLGGVTPSMAQAEMGLFNHVGVGLSLGALDGYGFEVAVPVTEYLSLRAGMSMLPKVKHKFNVDIDSDDPAFTDDEVEVEAKLDKSDFKVLLDIHPFKNSFRITAGAYIGKDKLISVYNTEPFLDPAHWGNTGIKLGDYRITSDENGNIAADVKVKKFKPYIGIGFGRAVPKRRVAFNFDLGVQIWGEPGIWTTTKDNFGDLHYNKLTKDDIDNDDADKFIDFMSKITVCPVISFRLTGRIF